MKKFSFLAISVLSLLLTSCYNYGVASYAIESTDELAQVVNNARDNVMAVSHEGNKFITSYTTNGDLLVTNNSDSTMFVDMGESYVLDRLGQATRLYTNAVTSSYSSGTTGASVNLGAVAGAFGIGGAVGTLARGINVGGSNTNGTTVQTFEERYISIPAHTSMQLKFTQLYAPELSAKKGQEKRYSFQNSPLAAGHHMTYTFDSEGKNWKSTRSQIYVDGMVGVKNKKEALEMAESSNTTKVVKEINSGKTCLLWVGGVIGYVAVITIPLCIALL